eukprot:scaffold3262_cov109-Isochrysis_galbana.AAC.6
MFDTGEGSRTMPRRQKDLLKGYCEYREGRVGGMRNTCGKWSEPRRDTGRGASTEGREASWRHRADSCTHATRAPGEAHTHGPPTLPAAAHGAGAWVRALSAVGRDTSSRGAAQGEKGLGGAGKPPLPPCSPGADRVAGAGSLTDTEGVEHLEGEGGEELLAGYGGHLRRGGAAEAHPPTWDGIVAYRIARPHAGNPSSRRRTPR